MWKGARDELVAAGTDPRTIGEITLREKGNHEKGLPTSPDRASLSLNLDLTAYGDIIMGRNPSLEVEMVV